MVKLGKYDLIAKIATGGMAEIHLARSHAGGGVDKIVVVKKLLAEFEGHKEFVDMFLDEARVAASLNHPNVVQMYDFGEVGGAHFMAMEYLNGEDLRRIYKHYANDKVMLPLRFTLHVTATAAAGLHHAHEACGADGESLQIVHRDVSPHNIFVTIDGAVKIVDFGIAKAKNRESLTKHGTLKGKAPYMAPEQVRNLPLDRRCDVYALGVVLYELTTGKRPYILDEASEFALLTSIVKGNIRKPSAVVDDYPPELEAIVLRALALAP
jgi:serine/threonine protein kinase